jgi:zinc protease
MPRLLEAAAVLPAVAGGAPASGAPGGWFPFPVHQRTLANGLKVVVIPFDSPGIVAFYTVVRAGSRNEIEAGHSGFAHFFEHMMFRGTDRYSADRYNDVLKALGADSNAFTTDDWTGYYIIGPSTALETMFDLESDRFRNLKYEEAAFKVEAGAVLGEYRKNFSMPFLALFEKLQDTAYTTHPYKHTTMGFLRDIEDMPNQYDYSLSFFDRFYRPEHCILLVVGDTRPDEAFALAQRYHGGWAPGSFRAEIPPEPPQTGPREATVPWANPTLPYVAEAYHVPAFSTTDPSLPALELVSELLFSESGTLYKELVLDRQWVDRLQGGPEGNRDPGLFSILARVKEPANVEAVTARIREALEEVKRIPVAGDRLADVKSHRRYAFLMSLDTAPSVAGRVAAYLELAGDPAAIDTVEALTAPLTAADLQAVARRVFVPENRTRVVLAPTTEGA